MLSPDSFVVSLFRQWIVRVSEWHATSEALLQAWCTDCAGSDFAVDVPDIRELPHSAVHELFSGLEAGYRRAHERLVTEKTDTLSVQWRELIDPQLMQNGWADLTHEYVLDLWQEFAVRRRDQMADIENWRSRTRGRMHDALQSEATAKAGLVPVLVQRTVQIAIYEEIDSVNMRTLAPWDGLASEEVDWMRREFDLAITNWMTWLPSADWAAGDALVPQGARCEPCRTVCDWLCELDSPHAVTHALAEQLDRILLGSIRRADWQLHEAPFELPAALARYERALRMVATGRRQQIERALSVYVKDRFDAAVREAGEAIVTAPET